jgi:hypothetical protein
MGGLFAYLNSCIFALFVKNGGSGQEKTPAEAGAYEGGKVGENSGVSLGQPTSPVHASRAAPCRSLRTLAPSRNCTSSGFGAVHCGGECRLINCLIAMSVLINLDQLFSGHNLQVPACSALDFQPICMIAHTHNFFCSFVSLGCSLTTS